MSRSINSAWSIVFVSLSCFFILGTSLRNADAALATLSSKIISDSPKAINLRIYSYDMRVDSKGDLHIIYSKPIDGTDSAEVWYVRRDVGTWTWKKLTSKGYRYSSSTFLSIGSDDLVHVSYIYDNGSGGDLYYLTIDNGVPSSSTGIFVSGGGFHTRMQLDENNHPVFLRGAQPGGVWKLALFTTVDDLTWSKSFLDLTQVPKFRLADFVYDKDNGTYHLTYGDTSLTRQVWDSKAMNYKVTGTFHRLIYATSPDGTSWTETVVDDSQWLYEMEFWTALELVDGRPLIGMYRYSEYNNVYNRGTYAKLSEWDGSSWVHKIITNQEYLDTSEGMGIGLAADGSGNYFGAWDFSPSYPQILPGSPKGNTAMRRSGPQNNWAPIAQLDSFSLEGRAKLRTYGGKLFYLALGDFTGPKLYFREYNIADLYNIQPPPPPSNGLPPGNTGGNLSSVYHILLHPSVP